MVSYTIIGKSKNYGLLQKTKSFRNAPALTPRYEDPIGDDMDECEPPPYWKELTKEEKLEILDQQMDSYWEEYYTNIRKNINWWKYSTYGLAMLNFVIVSTIQF
tara:strand:- start:7039 stop:7350 length:312 start_codon:yes stop_codon:yes gene_type:complete